jgi:hypothetical protein
MLLTLFLNAMQPFFDNVPCPVFKNSIKSHFASESLVAEQQKVYNFERGIVDTIVGEMMFNPSDDDDSDEDNDMEEDPGFGSPAELQALLDQCRATATKARDRALSLFKKVEFEDGDYSYSVTIPKTKTTVFGLVVRYVSCGTSFRMAALMMFWRALVCVLAHDKM